MPSPIKIVFCYARKDELLLNKLKTQLSSLEREGLITMWHDRDINAGEPWEHEIDKRLDEAGIILLLISPDFMNSDYCYSVEMKKALERRASGESTVQPHYPVVGFKTPLRSRSKGRTRPGRRGP